MSRDTSPERPPLLRFLTFVLGSIVLLVGTDVVFDLRNGVAMWHVGLELAGTLLALAGVAGIWWQVLAAHRRLLASHADLAKVAAEAERWRREAEQSLRGLGAAIDHQFERWELTPAEREIGLFLLKGLSLREIAELRETSERTVRQQTLAIYRKSGLAGRAELSAYFLEDLLLPIAPSP